MKVNLDWQSAAVVNIFDEVSLWSAPFARLMLENIPMKSCSTILDIGFGSGFPLIELAQRFDENATIYGIDVWDEAVLRAKEKIRVLSLTNVQIIEQSAEKIPLKPEFIDICCSNLGVNNFSNREQVISEIHRVLKANGTLCITTNPIGTFNELHEAFKFVLNEMKLSSEKMNQSFENRGSEESISKEFTDLNFKLNRTVKDQTKLRFLSGQALFNYGLIRIGFREYWEELVPKDKKEVFFEKTIHFIDDHIKVHGEFKMSIPILYMEFNKN